MAVFPSVSKTIVLVAFVLLSCSKETSHSPAGRSSTLPLKTHSSTPPLVKNLPGFETLKVYPLISSDDTLPQSPRFVFGGQPDGAALLNNPDGDGYLLITNHEVNRSVSRVFLDKSLKPLQGEYLVDGDGGAWRLCSATLATPAEHGFGPIYLTAGEGDPEGMIHAINPFGIADKKNKTRTLPALGRASFENAVPLPKGTYPGKTVIILSEDDGDGQLTAYITESVGDLKNGKLYVLRRTNQDPSESSITSGQSVEVEFVEMTGAKMATGAQLAARSKEQKAIQFARIEDVDYRKGGPANGREVYFAVTGVGEIGRVNWGRVYQLTLDEHTPLKGKLAVIADGVVDPGNNLINPDNICVTQEYVYIQEDGDSAPGPPKHDGRIWQYGIKTKQVKPMMEMEHRRGDVTFERKYNPLGNNSLCSWEFGAMIDVSDVIGVPNVFLINIHAHTWRAMKFANADGSDVTKAVSISDGATGAYTEGGQVLLVQGIAR